MHAIQCVTATNTSICTHKLVIIQLMRYGSLLMLWSDKHSSTPLPGHSHLQQLNLQLLATSMDTKEREPLRLSCLAWVDCQLHENGRAVKKKKKKEREKGPLIINYLVAGGWQPLIQALPGSSFRHLQWEGRGKARWMTPCRTSYIQSLHNPIAFFAHRCNASLAQRKPYIYPLLQGLQYGV